MKVYLRDRITAGLGIGVLAAVAAMSYYYSIHAETEALRAEISRESPDFTSTNIALTQFKPDGTAERRIFAAYAEHYEDGRMMSIKPRLVTLSVDEPQVKARADTGISMDAGETSAAGICSRPAAGCPSASFCALTAADGSSAREARSCAAAAAAAARTAF